jgi:hypothetical protein
MGELLSYLSVYMCKIVDIVGFTYLKYSTEFLTVELYGLHAEEYPNYARIR